MAAQIIPVYTFTPGIGGAGTVRLTDFSAIVGGRLLAIINATRNITIYQVNNPAKGGTFAANIVTLTYDTSAMSSGDKLFIKYDCKTGDPTYDKAPVTLSDFIFGEDSDNNVLGIAEAPALGSKYSPVTYRQFHNVTTANITPVPCNVKSISFINDNASSRFVQLFNTTTVPAPGNSCQISWEVKPNTTRVIPTTELAPSEYFSLGCAWGVSTIEGTYSAATATDHGVIIRYK